MSLSVQPSTSTSAWALNPLPSLRTALHSLSNKVASLWQGLVSLFTPKPPKTLKVRLVSNKGMASHQFKETESRSISLSRAAKSEIEGLEDSEKLAFMRGTTGDALLPPAQPNTSIQEPSTTARVADSFIDQSQTFVALFMNALGI